MTDKVKDTYSDKYDPNADMYGLAALKAALKPQEGIFDRRVTYLEGPSLDRMARTQSKDKETDNNRVAKAIQNRNADGTYRPSDAKE